MDNKEKLVNEIAIYCIYNAMDDEGIQSISFENIAKKYNLSLTQVSEIIESVADEIECHSGLVDVSINNSNVTFRYDESIEDELDEDTEYTDEEQEDDELLDEVMNEEQAKGNKDLFELATNPNLTPQEKAKKQTNLYLLVLKRYFQKECQKDRYFINKYKPELLEKCWNYCQSEVQKSHKGNVAMIKSYTIFTMAKAYFDDEIYIRIEKENAERQAKIEKENAEIKAKAEKERLAREQKAKEQEEKAKADKEREEQWKKFLAKDETCDLTKEQIEREKFKHLKQQNLFDF